jgi:DNA end-binding protein Ku
LRTAWKGTLQFGLLAIPLRLGLAADDTKSLFHQMHAGCGGRVKQSRYCEDCGTKDIAYADVAKGIEVGDGRMVEVTDTELEELRAWEPKTITLLHFAQASEVDSLLFDASYYVEPVDGGGPAHALLMSAIPEGLAAVCTIAYPQRLALALMTVRGGMFVLTTLRWPEQIRPADVKLPPVMMQPRPQETKMAAQMVKLMTRPFNAGEHVDTHRQSLVDLVGAKETGTPVAAVKAKDQTAKYTDMMSLLEQSIAEQKKTTTKPTRARKAPAAQAS